MKFSVVVSVYKNDNPEHVRTAVESVTTYQTLKPDEVVIIVDGPIPEVLSKVIDSYEKSHTFDFRVIRLPENKGLGNALRVGMEVAKYPIVVRMDSDDISEPTRFMDQIKYMELHPECDVVGGQISEFIGEPDNFVGKRVVPCNNQEIHARMKTRCPFNHMSVAMIRSKVLAVGNYIDWHFNEDYYLWIRMAQANYNFANLSKVLVNVRVGKDMYARRGGIKYFKSEKGLQDYMLKNNMISWGRYIFNVCIRFGVQVILPNKIRGIIFQKVFRMNSK